MISRYAPQFKFPEYAFRPGQHIHPSKEGGHSYQIEDPKYSDLDIESIFDHDAFLFSIDLFNYEYFWESHVYLEALWNGFNREGDVSNYLKGLIKLAAAGVKLDKGRVASGLGHIRRGLELLDGIEKNNILRIDMISLKNSLQDFLNNSTQVNYADLIKINLLRRR